MCITFLPEIYYEFTGYHFDGESYIYSNKYAGGTAIGSTFHMGMQADIYRTAHTIGNLKIGFLTERSNIPTSITSVNIEPEYRIDVFEWKSFSSYLAFSISF